MRLSARPVSIATQGRRGGQSKSLQSIDAAQNRVDMSKRKADFVARVVRASSKERRQSSNPAGDGGGYDLVDDAR